MKTEPIPDADGMDSIETLADCACSNCNSAHRKCDRKLPVCGGCARKKKADSCTYEYIPAKRLKRQIEKQKSQPYPTPNIPERILENQIMQNGLASQQQQQIQLNQQRQQMQQMQLSQQHVFKIPRISQLDIQAENNGNGQNPILPPINLSGVVYEQFPQQMQQQQEKSMSPNMGSPVMRQTPPMPTVVEKRETLNTTTSLEKYFEYLYVNSPLTNHENTQAILAYRRKLVTENDSSLISSLMTNRDDVALIFAMQAYYYRRFDVYNLSQRCFEIARSMMSLCYDNVLQSFSLAAAYINIGLILYDEGEIERAAFYFHTVDTFMKKNPKRIPETAIDEAIQTLQYRYLRCWLGCAFYFINEETDLKILLKCQIGMHFITKQYSKVKQMWDRQSTHKIVDDDFDEFLPYLDMIINDIINGTDSFRLDPGMIDVLSKKIRHTFDAPSERGLETDIRVKRLGFLLLSQAAKIQCFKEPEYAHLPEIELAIRQIADLIIALSTTGIFNFCSFICAQPIAIALSVHISCLSKAVQPRERATLVELIKLGGRALHVLSSRYNKTVIPKYGSIIREGEAAIKMHEERQQLVQLCTSLQNRTGQPILSPLLPSTSPDPSSLLVTVLDTVQPRPPNGNASDQMITNAEFETFLGEFLNDDITMPTTTSIGSNDTEFLFL